MREGNVIIAGSSAAIRLDPALIRAVRGSMWDRVDLRFLVILLISAVVNGAGLYFFYSLKLPAVRTVALEEIPERFARFIIEKPIPKETKQALTSKNATAQTEAQEQAAAAKPSGTVAPEVTVKQREAAKKTVAARAARVENKIRTVGVLGMLTGVGTTAKGPSVVDVLGGVGGRREVLQDLDNALGNMQGLQKTSDIAFVEKKLVKSKEVTLNNTESIDHLIAGIGAVQSTDLVKQGSIVIEKPEAIEGAGSASSKRDDRAINQVVVTHKAGINMSYQKYLKKYPALEGKITIRFTISSSGKITAVEVVENTTGVAELEQEIVRKIRMWQFDPIPEGDATVTFPFLFRPS